MTRTRSFVAGCAVTAALPLLAVAPALFAAQRTFVSTLGADANACTIAAPCRGFAKAIGVTDPGGEIVVLDSGGYGAVTVDKDVTINSPAGVYAGISVFAAADGITVVAPAAKVVLRGLSINGQGGNNGIRVQAGEVHVENVVVSNMGQAGILVEGGSSVRVTATIARSNADGLKIVPIAGTVIATVRDSEFSNHSGTGISVAPAGAGVNAVLTVDRSSVVKNGAGISANGAAGATATLVVTQTVTSENAGAGVGSGGSGATAFVRDSAVTRNGVGLSQAGSSVLNACGANLLVANAAATAGVINTSSCLDVASATGTVTSVATGPGVTGGPITSTGTIGLAATNLLPTSACVSTQVPKWNGAAWTCGADADSGGTVTSVGTAGGLTGGPITATGTISIAIGGVGATQLAGASVDVSKLNTASTDGRYFRQGGNAFGADAMLGTSDNTALELSVNGSRAARYEPAAISPNVIGGSPANNATAGVRGATIAGGGVPAGNTDPDFTGEAPNRVTDAYGTVGGGYGNVAGNDTASAIDAPFATVAGGQSNLAKGVRSTIGGGQNNSATGNQSTVAGGANNLAAGLYAAIGGGSGHTANGTNVTIAGGQGNSASGFWTAIGGGLNNTITADRSTVAGGEVNVASGLASSVGGGHFNTASGISATIAGGESNLASGDHSAIGGGLSNVASGDYSWAGGRRAMTEAGPATPHDGAFVWADSKSTSFRSTAANEFSARATGGVRFVTAVDGLGAPSAGVSLAPGDSAWSVISDRAAKENWVDVDGREVLEKLVAIPIGHWNYKAQSADIPHMGPSAQDFHAAFALGRGDTTISTVDADGVALAAIQGLNAKLEGALEAKNRQLNEQASALAEQQRQVAALSARLREFEVVAADVAAMKAALAETRRDREGIAAK